MKLEFEKLPEANIQAELFRLCRNIGINCFLEYTYEGCRFDAVIFDDDRNVLMIVECKSYKTRKPAKTNTKQINRYKRFGIPIIMLTRFENVKPTVKKILEILEDKCISLKRIKELKKTETL